MPLRPELVHTDRRAKVLLLGSGGLSIGQAGEFDYSGTQAIKALEEENIEVVIVNPNIATVQTNPHPKRKVYLYPVEPAWVEKVIAQELPDAIIAGFGGQTALNCLLSLDAQGILKKYNVLNLGTTVQTLRLTEDRDLFAKKMQSIGIPIPPSFACSTLEETKTAAEKIGYPVIVRAAYALGGLGSGFANNDNELVALAHPALSESGQVLVEKSLKGWKEVEYEVMRDGEGNIITICNMENFDPLGIHTGDSIVVCPSQSLSDSEYQLLRNASIKMIESLQIVGECNAQFALSPDTKEFFVIEVNARLSRSSALASKASGYPIAYIAAKVVLGYDLIELKNPMTGVTHAYFEPALDYITIKIPRWDLAKFRGASRLLDSTMKSVGEIMAIGRTFPEAIQKAVRMVTEHAEGLNILRLPADVELEKVISNPTDDRLFAVLNAFREHMDLERVYELSKIDKWFLYQLRNIAAYEEDIKACASHIPSNAKSPVEMVEAAFKNVSKELWQVWKVNGFADAQMAGLVLRHFAPNGLRLTGDDITGASLAIRKMREAFGVKPVVKKIDTTAAEHPSSSNYLYMTYAGQFDDPNETPNKKDCAIILGGGAYRVGTSVEFDWCAVSCSEQMRKAGWTSIIINCNPETVSTDFNSSDKLYFEELSVERILDIYQHENATGVVASMGGQLPNKLALSLASVGIKLMGHSPSTIDRAEDRSKFSALLDSIEVDQPRWIAATSKHDIDAFIAEVGFPVLVRPSYVLSGAAMAVASDSVSLQQCLALADHMSSDHPVVISEFVLGAREIELDGVASNGEILTAIVSEHIENAGIHSGDATMVVPAQKLYVETVRRVRRAGIMIARELELNGPFNMQFLAQQNHIKVIECNARAARSFPFVSKVVGLNLADAATQVMIGQEPQLYRLNEDELPYVGVKAAMFSFRRLLGADPVLGVEMASTGEVGCIGANFDEALILALESSGIKSPKKGILISVGREVERVKLLKFLPALKNLGIPIYGTYGTSKYFAKNGVEIIPLARPNQSEGGDKHVIDMIREGAIDFVINIPKNLDRKEVTFGEELRKSAIRFGCSLFTNLEKAMAYLQALESNPDFLNSHELQTLPHYRTLSSKN